MAKEQKLTAAQRIEGLEGMIQSQSQNMEFLAQEINSLRQTMTALARRINATIKAGEAGGVSNEVVNKLLVDENVEELKGKVNFLIEQKVLEETKDQTIGERSFVVGRELDEEKNVVNPRMQFALASLTEEAKKAVTGKKLGDIIENFSGDGLVLEITEVYKIAEEKEQKKEFKTEEVETKEQSLT